MEKYKLKNGINVLLYRVPHVNSFYISTIIKAGSLFEDKNEFGVSHLVEHYIMAGIKDFPTEIDLEDRFYSLNAYNNAFTLTKNIEVYSSAPYMYTAQIIEIIYNICLNPLFDPSRLKNIKDIIINEIKQKNVINSKIEDFFSNNVYKNLDNINFTNKNNTSIIRKIKFDQIVSYWERHFIPENMSLLVVGNINIKDVKKKIDSTFGAHEYTGKKNKVKLIDISIDNFKNNNIAFKNFNISRSIFTQIIIPIEHKDISAIEEDILIEIATGILVNSRNSRLKIYLRNKNGLIYDINLVFVKNINFHYVNLNFSCMPNNFDIVIRYIMYALLEFKNKGITKEEFLVKKKHYIGSKLMEFDFPDNVLDWCQWVLLNLDHIYTPDDEITLIKKIEYKNTNKNIMNMLDVDKMSFIINGDIDSKKYKNFIQSIINNS